MISLVPPQILPPLPIFGRVRGKGLGLSNDYICMVIPHVDTKIRAAARYSAIRVHET